MKNLIKLFLILFVVSFYSPYSAKAINPLYQLSATNINLGGSDAPGEIQFDIVILHTNFPDSGPFEFSTGKYYLNFNQGIANGGILAFSIVPNSTEFTNPNAIPSSASVSGNLLTLTINPLLGAGNGPIVSPIFPGTRIVRVSLTCSHPFAPQALHLTWRDSTSGEPVTKVTAYVGGQDTAVNGGMIVDGNDPLPVELSSFVSLVDKNNVTLNWTTASESNNYGFEIERSDAQNQTSNEWTKVGFVNGNGTTHSPENYTYNERLNSGKYKYRLRQIDFNGNSEYHNLNSEVVIGLPGEYALSQNYPNPFNPETNIDYELSGDGNVQIILYDVSGKEVAVLVNEVKRAGFYSVKFNASNLASGMYLYKIIAGDFTSTKKMILSK